MRYFFRNTCDHVILMHGGRSSYNWQRLRSGSVLKWDYPSAYFDPASDSNWKEITEEQAKVLITGWELSS